MNLDQLRSAADAHVRKYNETPLDDFCGLSPAQMHHLMRHPLGPESPVQLHALLPDEGLNQIPLLRLTEELLRMVGRDGFIKLTPLGAMPRKYLHELYDLGLFPEEAIEAGYVKLSREQDSTILASLHINTTLAGLVKKVHGKLFLTKKAEKLRPAEQRPALLRLVLDTFTSKFNWAYNDLYGSPSVGQMAWAYSIYLLGRFGDEAKPQHFYADLYRRAFPFTLDLFTENPYSTREEQLSSCYACRVFLRFTDWFGLTKSLQKQYGSSPDNLITASALLPRIFRVNQGP